MVAGDEKDEAVNVDEWCELLDKRLARFDGFAGKLKEEHSIVSNREEAEARRKEDLIQRKVQEKNGRRSKDRRNEDGMKKKGF